MGCWYSFINCIHPIYQKKKAEPIIEYKPVPNNRTTLPRVHVQSPKNSPNKTYPEVPPTPRAHVPPKSSAGALIEQSKFNTWLISQAGVPNYNGGREYR